MGRWGTIRFVMALGFTLVSLGTSGENRNGLRPQGMPEGGLKSSGLWLDADFGRMPLYFIPNEGQADSRVAFYIQGQDKSLYFSADGLTIVLDGNRVPRIADDRARGAREAAEPSSSRWAVKLDFVGADPNVRPAGVDKTGTVVSYFKGKPEDWRTGLPTYAMVVYEDLWPGIDLRYFGTVDRLKYEFVVHPGADPSRIRLVYRGADSVERTEDGRLAVATPAGGFEDDAPSAWQEHGGKRAEVPVAYALREHEYGFDLGDYDRSRPLVLDPAVFVYCGYIGGSAEDRGYAIDVDGSGNAYVTGYACSTESSFPVVAGPDLSYNSGYNDVFVAKVNASGTGFAYCGYIGGAGDDVGNGIAVDGSGNAYVFGYTGSPQSTFPVLVGPDLTHNGGTYDAFVAKVNASGTGLSYCGYIGGSADDRGNGIAVDSSGVAYLVGMTSSTPATFPAVVGPDLTNKGSGDAFVAKLNASGTTLTYCGYIGGSSDDYGFGIAIDGSGNAYVVGATGSTEATFPEVAGPDLSHNGMNDAFVAKVNSSGTALSYCGYIGGSAADRGYGIAVDASGNAYVIGYTGSTEATFPVLAGPDLTHNGGTFDAFAAKVNASGALSYCGYIGGSGYDDGKGIAVDGSGNAYFTGNTQSSSASFPVVSGPDLTYNGVNDSFVAKLNPSGSALVYCGYIGGASNDYGCGIAVDLSGNAYVAGYTYSNEASFTVVAGPDLSYNGGVSDAFVAKVSSATKGNLVGTWDGQGVYFRNSDTGSWTRLATPADMIACGDLGGDGIADLIGIWSGQAGVWTRDSAAGSWSFLGSSARHIGAGDMNGDGRVDFLGTWNGQGVYYKNSVSGVWTLIATPADLITAGDLDGDAKADLIGIWAGQAGVWVKYSQTGTWSYLGSSARDMTTGDMNGDGRADLVGTWDGQGVYYKDSISGAWTMIATPADQITAGDFDGDGKADLAGIWAGQAGVWVKYSQTQTWAYLGTSARDIGAGRFAGGAWGAGASVVLELANPAGGVVDGPPASRAMEISDATPGGRLFNFQVEGSLKPSQADKHLSRTPGPGDPGFRCAVEKNIIPGQ